MRRVEEIRYCGRNPAPVGRWFPLESHDNSSFMGIPIVTNSCRTIRMKYDEITASPKLACGIFETCKAKSSSV
jgi:hypothetical protein